MVVFDQARQDYILEIVLSIGKDPKSHFLKNVILPPLNRPDLPKLFFWCPVSQYDCRVVCLTHHCEVKCGEWLDNVTKRSNRNPRIAFDVFENIVFIQRQYTCSSGMRCGPVLSNDIDVMEQLPRDVQARFPFRKYHLTVMTHELIDLIFEQILRGLPISQIGESIVNLRSSKYARKEVAIAEQLASFCDDELYSFPSKSNIRNIVIDEYNRTEHYYKSSMALLDLGEVISIYKITKDAGELSFGAPKFWLKDRQVFIILNDRSQVLYWKLCPEITVDVTANVLNEFSKHPNASAIKTILIEKCCQEKDLYQTFFPNAEIKMTIYHAVRHVTQHIPNPQSFQTLSLVKKFGFVFRNPSDSEKEQLANTPPAEHIISNLSDFVNTEKQTLESFPEENRSKLDDAMRNLVIHIQNGCLSNIKPGFATEPCERLHRLLKRSALADANTPSNEFVTTILAITFHHYNEKKKNLHHVCSKDIIVYPARKPFIPDHTTDIKASVHRVLEETLYPVDPDRITVAEFLWKKTFYLKQTVFLFKKKFRMVDMINLMLLKELGFQFPEGDGLEDLEITLEENKKEGCIETLITAILDQLNAHGLIDVLTKFDALPGSDCDVIPRFLAHIATACKEWEITFDLEHIDLKEDAARCFLSEVIAEMISIPMALIDANQIGNINLFIPDLPLDHDTILVIAYKSSNGLFYATTSEVASTGNIKQQCRCGWKTSSMKCCTLGSGCSCVAEKRGCMECRCHVIKCQNKIQGDDTVLKPAKIRNELISCRCSRGDKCCSGKRCPCFNENQGCVSKCECFGGKCRNSYGRNVAEGKDKPAPTQDQKKQRKRRRDTILTNYPSKLKKDEESKSEATWQEYDIAALIICLQTLKKMQLELSSYNVHLLYQLLVADHFLHIGKKSLEQIEEKLTVFQTNDLVVLQTLELNSNSILQDINNCITEQQQITEPESSITMEQVISQTQSSVIKKSDTVEKETLLETVGCEQ